MVSENIVNIILKMEDRATAIAEKAEQSMKKLGNTAQQSNNKTSQAAQQSSQKMEKLRADAEKVVDKYIEVGNKGRDSFNSLSKSQQQAVVQFHKLDEEAQATLIAIRELGKGFGGNLSYETTALINRFNALTVETNTWKGSLDYAKTKLQMLGTNTDTLKGKIQLVGSTIQTYVGSKWDAAKNKVTSFAESIKVKVGGAIDTVRNKLATLNNAFKVVGQGLTLLKSALSMTVGMVGFELFNSFVTAGHAAINASGQLDYFAGRLNLSQSRIKEFNTYLDNMQKEFRKVDMTAVGASAEELAVKLQLSDSSLEKLTRTIAVTSSAFVKEGRTQEDAILAVSDALDGQWMKLKELGITQDDLIRNGWNEDLNDKNSLLDALNKTLKEMGFEDTAKDITNLDDALQALTVVGGNLIEAVLVPITPYLIHILEAAMNAADGIMNFIGVISDGFNNLPDWAKIALGVSGIALAVAALGLAIQFNLIPGLIGTVLHFIAVELHSFIMVASLYGLSGAFSILAGSIWATIAPLITILAPILAVVAVLAVLAVAIYEIGKYFGWWKDIPTMIDAIKSGIMRLWEAFINNPNVQGFLKDLGNLWEGVCDALKPVVDWAKQVWSELFPPGANWDIVQSIIDIFGAVGRVLGDVVNAIKIAYAKFGLFGAIVGILTAPIQVIVGILRLIICALLGCSPGIVPALQKVWDVFQEVFNAIASFIGSIISPIVEAIRPLLDIFVQIVTYLVEMFMPVWDLIVQVLTLVVTTVFQIIDVFQQFLSGQITLPQLLSAIWDIIWTYWSTILTTIINFVLAWAGQILAAAINAASGFVNGIITWISSLPGRFWNYLVQTTSNIISAGAQWVSNAKQKAMEMVNGAATTVQQLPGKIYTEFTKVPQRIQEALPAAIQAAINYGKEILKGVLDALGIHSPGIIQNSISDEFSNTVEKIKDTIKPAGEYARQVGEAIVDKFGDPKLSMDTEDLMPYTDLDMDPLENIDLANLDLAGMTGGLDSAVGMTDETNTMIGESYDALALMMSNTLNNMVLQDQIAYGNIQSNDLSTFQAISTGLNLNLLSMSTNLNTQLNSMLMTHRNAMNSANNTTRQQLAAMLAETTKVVSEMRSAWSVMADSIISAAARIKNEATSYFNQLASTIGSFYKKLQNPAQWAGGDSTGSPASVRRVGRDPAVMTRLTRGVANNMRRDSGLTYTITATKARSTGLVNPLMLEYMNKSPSATLNLLDLIQRGACPNCFAGGWIDTAAPNVAYIKKVAREWSMKGPAVHTGVGDIDTGLSFKVKDFEGGRPNISWDSFVRIATAIASAIPYSLYYNSDKYGSWQGAIAAGEWNCFDGASAMVALANACGFGGGYVDCGLNWGGFGHCCAVINGYTFDTTALRQRGGWAAGPCNYSHPAPAGGINVKIPAARTSSRTHVNPLEGLFDNNSYDSNNSENVTLTLEHNVNVNIDGNTENVDTQALIDELKASVTDRNIIDKIADALIRRDKRINRMGGAV